MKGSGVMLLILQLAVILTVTNLCGWLMGRVGQPRAVGEIVGGLVLGPLIFRSVSFVDMRRKSSCRSGLCIRPTMAERFTGK
jgi:Kef-type K+ transport system membrane component KefB